MRVSKNSARSSPKRSQHIPHGSKSSNSVFDKRMSFIGGTIGRRSLSVKGHGETSEGGAGLSSIQRICDNARRTDSALSRLDRSQSCTAANADDQIFDNFSDSWRIPSRVTFYELVRCQRGRQSHGRLLPETLVAGLQKSIRSRIPCGSIGGRPYRHFETLHHDSDFH